MKRLPIILLLFLISFGFSNLNAQTIVVDTVINNIKIGPFTENKNLAFGVKNIIEEIINEQDSLILFVLKLWHIQDMSVLMYYQKPMIRNLHLL